MIWRSLAALAVLTFALPAAAEEDHLTNGCASFAVVLRLAMAQYGEAPAWIATTGNGIVIAFTVNPKTGSWTMWGQRVSDSLCVVTSGDSWQPATNAVKQVAPAGKPS